MSILDRFVAAVTPTASDEDRTEARQKVQAMAEPGSWLALAIDHHRRIEAAFAEAFLAPDAAGRTMAMKQLATVLTGHANAEESVLYPALADNGEKTHASMAFEEQAMTKIQMAKLEKIDPMSKDWTDKLDHIRGAVLEHIYQEEHSWFPDLLRKVPAGEQQMLTRRFTEEYERYAGRDGAVPLTGA